LTYTGVSTVGNAIFGGTGSALRQWDLASSGLFNATGDSIWFSFLATPETTSDLHIGILDSAATGDEAKAPLGAYIKLNGSTSTVYPWIINGGNNNTFVTTTGVALQSGANLIVGQITYNGGFFTGGVGATSNLVDKITLWVNPTLGSAPVEGVGNTVTYLGSLSTTTAGDAGGYVVTRSGSGFNGQFDELYIGTTPADVMPVPEPSTAALAVVGGFALVGLAVRRRR
jgi:hypothetical protein